MFYDRIIISRVVYPFINGTVSMGFESPFVMLNFAILKPEYLEVTKPLVYFPTILPHGIKDSRQ